MIVDPANYGKWLAEELKDAVHLSMMLRPFPTEQMESYPGRRDGRERAGR
jgi:hypothetical protein